MNVLVICIDTFRPDMVGKGKKLSHVKTPHLDTLESESVVFDRCFAEGLPTIPVRRCVFTGKRSFPWRFDTPNEGLQPAEAGWHPIPHEMDTLAERFHDAGYATGIVSDVYQHVQGDNEFHQRISVLAIHSRSGERWIPVGALLADRPGCTGVPLGVAMA
jgi:arylsulfatase A-like enzyme